MDDSQRIALDVMGGDSAPTATLAGALRAVSTAVECPLKPDRILLVGDAERIEAGLTAAGGNPGFDIRHASQEVDMHDSPAAAMRSKPDSSIAVAVAAVKQAHAGAVVSMGNTGALVASATRGLGTLEGVRRPGIAVTLAMGGKPLTVLDMGANIAPKPEHLLHYGMMGSIYARECLRTLQPRVGLLNIGEESSKGTELLRASHQLLSAAPIEFVGNVEGNTMFQGDVDVIVADGFTGNVVLKLLEGFSGFMMGLVMRELVGHGADYGQALLSNVQSKIDYAEYGGALLLGVRGVVIVGHGRSDAVAVSNAIALAARTIDADLNAGIVTGLANAQAN
jgi:glycerol-3-phosphate acyltransferase PlsX